MTPTTARFFAASHLERPRTRRPSQTEPRHAGWSATRLAGAALLSVAATGALALPAGGAHPEPTPRSTTTVSRTSDPPAPSWVTQMERDPWR